MSAARTAEIDRNFQFFQGFVASLLPESSGKYALLRNQSCVKIHPNVISAIRDGETRFEDGLFSVQEVTDSPLDLGFFSHANPVG